MSKFRYWDLQKSFTDNTRLLDWLTDTFDSNITIYMVWGNNNKYHTLLFSLDDYRNTDNYVAADKERRKRTGDDYSVSQDDVDIYWIHEVNYPIGLHNLPFYDPSWYDYNGIKIMTVQNGHYVFRRKTSYPKPALRP